MLDLGAWMGLYDFKDFFIGFWMGLVEKPRFLAVWASDLWEFVSRATVVEILRFLSWMIDCLALFDLVYFVEFIMACVGTGWGSHFGRFRIALFWVSECVWFGMPIYFGMPFLPRFRYAELASSCELRVRFGWPVRIGMPDQGLDRSTGGIRRAELGPEGGLRFWFGRPDIFDLPNQTLEPEMNCFS